MLCKCGTLNEYHSNNPLTKKLACYLVCPFCKPKKQQTKELNNGKETV